MVSGDFIPGCRIRRPSRRCCSYSFVRPAMPPLFLDGFIVFSSDEPWLSLPSNKIDYNSPWTEWKGAVRVD